MFAKWRGLPIHWKILLGGQAIITVGIMGHRLSLIREVKAAKRIPRQLDNKRMQGLVVLILLGAAACLAEAQDRA